MHSKTLSDFCTELTGITQDIVEKAETIEAVYWHFLHFLADNNLSCENTVFCTCGDWDLKTMWPKQAHVSKLPIPDVFRGWINIQKIFQNIYNIPRYGMMSMLQHLGLQHQGRHHSGIDDTKNIARIVVRLMEMGAVFNYTTPPQA